MKKYEAVMRFTVLRAVEVEANDLQEAYNKMILCEFTYEGHDEDVIDWGIENGIKEVKD